MDIITTIHQTLATSPVALAEVVVILTVGAFLAIVGWPRRRSRS